MKKFIDKLLSKLSLKRQLRFAKKQLKNKEEQLHELYEKYKEMDECLELALKVKNIALGKLRKVKKDIFDLELENQTKEGVSNVRTIKK